MKNVFFFLFLSIGTTGFAQIKFAPEIGLSLYKQRYEVTRGANSSTLINSDLRPGIKAGIAADIAIQDAFTIQPNLYYSWNRTNIDLLRYGTVANVNTDRSLHVLQLPIYFLYNSNAAGASRFFGGAGPYFSYALAGKDQVKTQVFGFSGSNTRSLTFGDVASDDMRPFGIGGSLVAGYESALGAYVKGYFNFGMNNLMPDGDSENKLHDMGFGLTVGYFIN